MEELAVILREQPISEILVTRQESRVHLRKGAAAVPAAAPTAVSAHEAPSMPQDTTPAPSPEPSILLSSQIVGIFHHANPPIRVGSTVKAGQLVGNVEAMKLMNEVSAEAAGQVVEVLVEDGEPVDYGRLLFRMVPA